MDEWRVGSAYCCILCGLRPECVCVLALIFPLDAVLLGVVIALVVCYLAFVVVEMMGGKLVCPYSRHAKR